MATNPRRQDLDVLYNTVSNRIDDLREALNATRQVMADGDAWTGTQADIFGDDIGYRRTDLINAAETLLEDVQAARDAEPEELPDNE